MLIEVKVPLLPESVADATVLNWHKKSGDKVKRDETLVELETDKVVLEVPAPEDGILETILKEVGAHVLGEEILAKLNTAPVTTGATDTPEPAKQSAPIPAAPTPPTPPTPAPTAQTNQPSAATLSPSVRRIVAEHEVDSGKITGSGKDGRLTKSDVINFIETQAPKANEKASQPVAVTEVEGNVDESGRFEKRVPMSRLRARIAERLLESQSTTAMLTTFNEVNLQAVMDLRKRYKDDFEKAHGVKLGFMSFFTKAVVEALKRFPMVNASIDGNDVVYHDYYDVGIAVSAPRGLVVPILRNADKMSLADIEKNISQMAVRARDGKLTMEEMTGGTFTISNGGTFGSLLSTPILNPPQSAILGMHKIEERAVVESGQIVVRPMMYLALTYDHRIIDGRESVSFLVTIKNFLEDPGRLLLDI